MIRKPFVFELLFVLFFLLLSLTLVNFSTVCASPSRGSLPWQWTHLLIDMKIYISSINYWQVVWQVIYRWNSSCCQNTVKYEISSAAVCQHHRRWCINASFQWNALTALNSPSVYGCRNAGQSSGDRASWGRWMCSSSETCGKTTSGITPANYSLGVLWWGGPLSCLSQVRWALLSQVCPVWLFPE